MTVDEDILDICFQEVAHNMKKLREQYALTQKEMSKKLNIDSQYYARLERGDDPKRRFTLEKVFLACSLFNVKPNDLLTKLPDLGINGYSLTNLQNDVSKKMKKMSVEQLNELREYMKSL